MFFGFLTFAQEANTFVFEKSNKRSIKVNFFSLNNLIIIPVEVNGVHTNFLVDTGLSKTLLFSFDQPELLNTENLKRIKVKGFGEDEDLYAFRSQGNQLRIKTLVNNDAEIYLLFNDTYNLSKKLGINIGGIIGYDLFKDFIVRINYSKKQLKFYQPEQFNRSLWSFQKKKISLEKDKPYLKTTSKDNAIQKDSIKLLIDTGSSDALWLVENEGVFLKKPNFNDILGYGFIGLVEGKRSKLDHLQFGNYQFNDLNVAYPDEVSFSFLEEVKNRDGSIGSEFMRRFTWFFDYPNKNVYFKANSYFDDPFIYDMSGLVLKYEGFDYIQKTLPQAIFVNADSNYQTSSKENQRALNVRFEIVEQLKIAAIRPNSPAYFTGLMKDDIILEINKKPAYKNNLEQITKILSSGHKDRVKLKIDRNGKVFEVDLYLQDRLKVLED